MNNYSRLESTALQWGCCGGHRGRGKDPLLAWGLGKTSQLSLKGLSQAQGEVEAAFRHQERAARAPKEDLAGRFHEPQAALAGALQIPVFKQCGTQMVGLDLGAKPIHPLVSYVSSLPRPHTPRLLTRHTFWYNCSAVSTQNVEATQRASQGPANISENRTRSFQAVNLRLGN